MKTTSRSNPDVRTIDTGGDFLTVKLIYPDGYEIARKVKPAEIEGRKGKDLIAAMRRSVEGVSVV